MNTDSYNDWKPWAGGQCPVAVGTRIETKHRDGSTSIRTIEYWTAWNHLGTPCDIVAYRIIEAKG